MGHARVGVMREVGVTSDGGAGVVRCLTRGTGDGSMVVGRAHNKPEWINEELSGLGVSASRVPSRIAP